MKVEEFISVIHSDFFTGVPDSLLKPLCNYLMDKYGIDKNHHIIAANEGNCVGLAAGYHLSTGKVPVVYMQNSGEGNIVNPVTSLLNDKVYAIPMIFVIGWRGEPGVHDEPQHIYQGEITTKLLDDLDIAYFIVSDETNIEELTNKMEEFNKLLENGKQVAFVIKKNAFVYDNKVSYSNNNLLNREEVVKHITSISVDDIIVSTTGKVSRELFEIRESQNKEHKYDFLTVGSMGHSSSIALGVAINKPDKKVWCIDGDGAALMHLGSIPVIGSIKPSNLIHILINNAAHETVGGLPTVSTNVDYPSIAKSCGYEYVASVDNYDDLDKELKTLKESNKLSFLEIKCSLESRKDLGRPTTTAKENKINFMNYVNKMF